MYWSLANLVLLTVKLVCSGSTYVYLEAARSAEHAALGFKCRRPGSWGTCRSARLVSRISFLASGLSPLTSRVSAVNAVTGTIAMGFIMNHETIISCALC